MASFNSKYNLGDKITYTGMLGDTILAKIEAIKFTAIGIRYRARNRRDLAQWFEESDIESVD